MNRAFFEPTTFTNVRTGSVTHGYRAYDDTGQTYCNTFEEPPATDDLNFLEQVMENGPDDFVSDMFDWVLESQTSICIGGEWYTYDKVKNIITA